MADRALVLGGGGVTGIAWEIGMLTGLAEGGTNLSDADLVVGTSAGSVVATLITTETDLTDRYATQLEHPGDEIAARISGRILLRYALAMLRTRDPQRYRARLGAFALTSRTVPEAERREVISSRLAVFDWPDRPLKITAIDADSGEFVVFDRDSGVDLVDAVAASCAVPGVWPPVTIGGRRHIDGGMRAAVNADLADGYARVVVLAPITAGIGPIVSATRQVAELRAAGAQVVLISPDEQSRRAIGPNVLDPARRAAAAQAGRVQAQTELAKVAALWDS
jgi:NTE family protein